MSQHGRRLDLKSHSECCVLMQSDKIKELLKNIEEDCLKLQKQGALTEFGKGQLELIKILKEYFL